MTATSKLWKYRLLMHLPGERGAKYRKRYRSRTAGRDFLRALKKTVGLTAIDLGANVGEYTRLMAAHAGRVIAFEPDPWTVARLREAVAGLSNVEIVEAAVGVASGEVHLYRHREFETDPVLRSQSSSVLQAKDNISLEKTIPVRQVDFIEYLEALDEDVGVLKLDIEGAEVDILEALFDRPALLSRIRYVFAETHERHIPEHAERVKALHHRVRWMRRPRVNLYWR